MADSIGELKRKTVLAHKMLAMTGNTGTTTGHVFARISEGSDEFLARGRREHDWSPTWVGYDALHTCGLDGKPTEDWEDWVMPPERHIAMAIFKTRPDVGCVIHAHPYHQVLCSISDVELRPILGAPYGHQGTMMAIEGVPVHPRSVLIASEELGEGVQKTLGNKTACILYGHGNVVVGRTVEEATMNALSLEHLAKHCWQVALAGRTARDIPQEDIEEAVRPRSQAAIERRAAGGAHWEWMYWVKLIEQGGQIPAEVLMRVR